MFLFYFTLFSLWIFGLVLFCFGISCPVDLLLVCFYFQFSGLFLEGEERYKKTEIDWLDMEVRKLWRNGGKNMVKIDCINFLNQKFKKEKWFTVFLSRYARES